MLDCIYIPSRKQCGYGIVSAWQGCGDITALMMTHIHLHSVRFVGDIGIVCVTLRITDADIVVNVRLDGGIYSAHEITGFLTVTLSVFDTTVTLSIFEMTVTLSAFDMLVTSSVFDMTVTSSVFDMTLTLSVFDMLMTLSVFDMTVTLSVFVMTVTLSVFDNDIKTVT